jgi:hypothetical protein
MKMSQQGRVDLFVDTNVSEKHIASIFRTGTLASTWKSHCTTTHKINTDNGQIQIESK